MNNYVKRRNNYFMLEDGTAWTPIGLNEGLTWNNISEEYFMKLKSYNINCLRMMFECAQFEHGLLESSQGMFINDNVEKWKNIFELCKAYDVKLLMSPYDTFWQWQNWDKHPYNKKNGGYLENISDMLSDPNTLNIHKTRFKFLIENFSNSDVIFAWDLWNEIHPSYNNETDKNIAGYIQEMGDFVRQTEQQLFGRSHLQTCSMAMPAIIEYNKLNLLETVFKHPNLDFCNVHFYDSKTINNPKDTIASAVRTAAYTRDCIGQIKDGRPFFDSESGPMDTFNDGRLLEENFDVEYFKNMCWAHLASGGAGAGMRWPYRHPHALADSMMQVLSNIALFSKQIDWNRFHRVNLSNSIICNGLKSAKIFCCGTESKFIMYVLRTDQIDSHGMFKQEKKPNFVDLIISIPKVITGNYRICSWNEKTQQSSMQIQATEIVNRTTNLTFAAGLNKSLMLYIEKL